MIFKNILKTSKKVIKVNAFIRQGMSQQDGCVSRRSHQDTHKCPTSGGQTCEDRRRQSSTHQGETAQKEASRQDSTLGFYTQNCKKNFCRLIHFIMEV